MEELIVCFISVLHGRLFVASKTKNDDSDAYTQASHSPSEEKPYEEMEEYSVSSIKAGRFLRLGIVDVNIVLMSALRFMNVVVVGNLIGYWALVNRASV